MFGCARRVLKFRARRFADGQNRIWRHCQEACLAYTPGRRGDYVLVHVGFALSRIDEEEAQEIFTYLTRSTRRACRELAGDEPDRQGGDEGLAAGGEVSTSTSIVIPSVPGGWQSRSGGWHTPGHNGNGQTHSILRFAIDEMLPRLTRSTPGCPVCVTPIEILTRPWRLPGGEVILLVYDMLRAGPGRNLTVKSEGAACGLSIRRWTPCELRENPDREVVFFAVGFETAGRPARWR